MSRFKLTALFSLFVFSLLLPSAAHSEEKYALVLKYQEERILSYLSDIKVNPDGSMDVTETIQVVALGEEIKRGIYRDFPTDYKTKWGFRRTTPFQVLETLRDGRPESHHLERQENGTRVYLGKADVNIPPGVYTYTIRYKTSRQLGFFSDHDELYWNVTGNSWIFPIDEITARVTLPEGVLPRDLKVEGYTGYQDSTEKNLSATVEKNGRALFRNTVPLQKYQGMTVVASWPKGLVRPPSPLEERANFLRDNRMVVVGVLGLGALLLYYLFVWFQVGRDPTKGTVIPLFEPPDNLSPPAMRFIWEMGYDDKAFAAGLIHLAVEKRLKIEEEGSSFVLQKLRGAEGRLAPEESNLYQHLFVSQDRLELKRANRATIVAAAAGLKKDLKTSFEKAYFLTNRAYFIGGLIVTLMVLLVSLFQGGGQATAGGIFIMVWLTGWSFAVARLFIQMVAAWQAAWNARGLFNKTVSFFGAGTATLFALPFLAGEIFGLYFFGKSTSPWMLLIFLAAVGINLLFFHLLKAPTLGGRKLLDHIEGLRMYLGTAEQDRLQAMHPPQKTPELFEKFLPYALALDVENEWAEQFTEVLAQAGTQASQYRPLWYAGTGALTAGAIASSLSGSLTSAISSSSVAPGSSSGGGGGGSSGGGGGGGGGGGW